MNVAVILPALDAEAVIGEQLAALKAQDYPGEFSILVCDNGSTDRTRQIAQAHGATVVDASAVKGCGPARNAGARATTSEYLLFCDADDVVAPGWVSAMVAALDRHPVVFGQIDIKRLNSVKAQVGRPVAPALQCGSNGLPYAGDGNMAIHRSVFLELGGFDEAVSHLHDVDFCWRLLAAGYDLTYEPAALNHIRLRDSMGGVYKQGFTYGRGWSLCVAKHRETAERLAGKYDALMAEYGIDTGAQGGSSLYARIAPQIRSVARGIRRHPVGGVGQAIWQFGWKVGRRKGLRELADGQITFGGMPVPSGPRHPEAGPVPLPEVALDEPVDLDESEDLTRAEAHSVGGRTA